jgi:hypothetical protein
MPDPIRSSSLPPGPTCSLDDDTPLTSQSTPPASPAATPNACFPPDIPGPPAPPSAASELVQKFPRAEQAVLVAAAPWPPTISSATGPGILTVRPDQVDLETGIPRIQGQATLAGIQLTAGIDILNASAHLGSLNGDGSRGENIGVGANLLGGELSIDYRGWSFTVGVAASLGVSISSGDGRDIDGDGVQERCFAMSLGPYTLGECDEL